MNKLKEVVWFSDGTVLFTRLLPSKFSRDNWYENVTAYSLIRLENVFNTNKVKVKLFCTFPNITYVLLSKVPGFRCGLDLNRE